MRKLIRDPTASSNEIDVLFCGIRTIPIISLQQIRECLDLRLKFWEKFVKQKRRKSRKRKKNVEKEKKNFLETIFRTKDNRFVLVQNIKYDLMVLCKNNSKNILTQTGLHFSR